MSPNVFTTARMCGQGRKQGTFYAFGSANGNWLEYGTDKPCDLNLAARGQQLFKQNGNDFLLDLVAKGQYHTPGLFLAEAYQLGSFSRALNPKHIRQLRATCTYLYFAHDSCVEVARMDLNRSFIIDHFGILLDKTQPSLPGAVIWEEEDGTSVSELATKAGTVTHRVYYEPDTQARYFFAQVPVTRIEYIIPRGTSIADAEAYCDTFRGPKGTDIPIVVVFN